MATKRTCAIMAAGFTLFFVFHILGCKNEEKGYEGVDTNPILTKKQIIEIANREAISRGMKVNIWTKVLYDVDNKEWKERYAYIKEAEPKGAEPYAVLEKANYQTVRYSSRIPEPGGILWVFVDRKTGKVIAVLQEY